jgi:hypothetical protein
MENTVEKKKRSIKRSPGYPMISLQEAIEKAKALWGKDKNNNIPLQAAYQHLGYQSMGGYAARIMAALKKFELISEDKGSIKLTNEAIDIILHEPSDEHHVNTIRKLALRPIIYERIFNDFDGRVPSDATLKIKLIRDYGFNAGSVDDFISTFKQTMEYANLIENDGLQETTDETFKKEVQPGIGAKMQTIERDRSSEQHMFPIPLSKRNQATIAFENLPVEKKDIDSIKKWLELFTDSLTENEKN